MANTNKSSLDFMLQAVLAWANADQSQNLPPKIYEQFYNTTTSFILTRCAELWQNNQRNTDIVQPFLVNKRLPVTNGYVQLPSDTRNFLDAAIFANINLTGECGDAPQAILEVEFKNAQQKSKCLTRPIEVVTQSEFDYLTTHPYDFPTYKYPIGVFFETNKLKVCPYDLNGVEIRYFKNEKIYKYGYITQPDDTYVFDEKTSVETEWQTNAFDLLFRGITTLYSAFTRDRELRDWNMELKKIGLI